MDKGIYPAVAYALLFSVGIIFSAMIYNFAASSMEDKQESLESAQAERICAYLADLAGKDAEIRIDVRDYRLESNPLRVIGKNEHICPGNLAAGGRCSGTCIIKGPEEGGVLYISSQP
jgi:hypothetical protein